VKGTPGVCDLYDIKNGKYYCIRVHICVCVCMKPEGKRPLGRLRRRFEENIKIYVQKVGWGAWTELIWLRVGTGGRLL